MRYDEIIRRILQIALILVSLELLLMIGINGGSSDRREYALDADVLPGVGPDAELSRTDVFRGRTGEETEDGQPEGRDGEDDGRFTLVMVGDMLMHDAVLASGKQEDGSYQYDKLFENVADRIRQSDLAIVNQETVLGGTELGLSGYPTFNSPWELGDSEVRAGFNVILHATNHINDMGTQGIINTITFWEENYPNIPYLGINLTKEHKENYLCVYEIEGIRVAILNYTYGTNGGRVSQKESYLIDYLDEEAVISDLQRADRAADFVVVCPHWGTEYQLTADANQRKWTKIFFEHGADLVIGAHPHVIQPIEWVTDEHGKDMLVYYSLGNFVNGTKSTGDDVLQRIIGGMAEVTIGRDSNGDAAILDYGVEPLICHSDSDGGYTTYFLSEYTEELAGENEYRYKISGLNLQKCWAYVENVWGDHPGPHL